MADQAIVTPEDIKAVARNIGESWFGPGHHDSAALAVDIEIALMARDHRVAHSSRSEGRVAISYDGFVGDVIGHYTTREGRRGVVVQQDGTKVVHVYGENRVTSIDPSAAEGRGRE